MSSSMHPELLTCVGSSASLQTRPSALIYRGLTVQTNRATSDEAYALARQMDGGDFEMEPDYGLSDWHIDSVSKVTTQAS